MTFNTYIHDSQRMNPISDFQLLPYSHSVTTAGSFTCLNQQIFFFFTPDGLPATTPEGSVSPTRIEPGIFHVVGKRGNEEQTPFIYDDNLFA